MSEIPAEAYPVAVYSAHKHTTPDAVRTEATETAICMWIDGLMIGVPLNADDTRLNAAINTAYTISQNSERFAALVRAELERRDRVRKAEPTAAALRAAEHPHDQTAETEATDA
ncbi:hypothetical protein [Microtetraspora glauca]|uniref:Uncharacterized protein n=1 Tax=Microtetraspora glauca TaxID=1996 RepID=A0ABV3GA58_MICGL